MAKGFHAFLDGLDVDALTVIIEALVPDVNSNAHSIPKSVEHFYL